MKYLFATCLVIAALVMVFHVDRFVPVPQAVGVVMNSAVAKHMPFGVQAAYAESCISGLEGQQDRTRHAVADAAVRIKEMDDRILALWRASEQSVMRIRAMSVNQDEVDEQTVAEEVSRYDDLQWRLTHAWETRDHLCTTLSSLESAEGHVGRNLTKLNDRLDLVQLDHEHNNVLSLASELAAGPYPGRGSAKSHGPRVIENMEHKERVREELHRRYAPAVLNDRRSPISDPWERAREIADRDC